MTSTIYGLGLLLLLLIDVVTAAQLTGIEGLKQQEQHSDSVHVNVAAEVMKAGAIHLAAVPLVRSEPKQKAIIPLDGIGPVEAQEALENMKVEMTRTIPGQATNAWEQAKQRAAAAEAKVAEAQSHSQAPPKVEDPKPHDTAEAPAKSNVDGEQITKDTGTASAEAARNEDKGNAAAKAQQEDEKMEDAIVAGPTGHTVAQDEVAAAPAANANAAEKQDQPKEMPNADPVISDTPQNQKQPPEPSDPTAADVSSPTVTAAVHDVASASSASYQAPESPNRQPPQAPAESDPSPNAVEAISDSHVPAVHPPDVPATADVPEQQVEPTNAGAITAPVAQAVSRRWMPRPEIRDTRDEAPRANAYTPSADATEDVYDPLGSHISDEAVHAQPSITGSDTPQDVALRLREKALRLKAMGERLRKLSQDADSESARAEEAAYEAEENAMKGYHSHSLPDESQGDAIRMASPEENMDYPPDTGITQKTDEERAMEKRVRTGNMVMLACAMLLPVTALVIAVHVFGRKPQRNESSLQSTFSAAQLDAAIASQVAAMNRQRPISPEPSPYRAAPPEAPCGRRISRPWGAVRTPSRNLESDVGIVH